MYLGSESLKDFEDSFGISIKELLINNPEHKFYDADNDVWKGVYFLNDNEFHFYADEIKDNKPSKELMRFFVRYNRKNGRIEYYQYEDFTSGIVLVSELKEEFISL